MKMSFKTLLSSLFLVGIISSCSQKAGDSATTTTSEDTQLSGQSGVQDDESLKNIVQIAAASADHTTLVTAVKAAEYVDVLVNAGPFTVFAPTNAAFEKLPAGTVEGLLKPESKDALRNILEYHVSIGGFKTENFRDGQIIGQANGDNITMTQKDGNWYVNGAKIIGSAVASNGLVHIIDGVLLPPDKK